jgi:hypothetical protein
MDWVQWLGVVVLGLGVAGSVVGVWLWWFGPGEEDESLPAPPLTHAVYRNPQVTPEWVEPADSWVEDLERLPDAADWQYRYDTYPQLGEVALEADAGGDPSEWTREWMLSRECLAAWVAEELAGQDVEAWRVRENLRASAESCRAALAWRDAA